MKQWTKHKWNVDYLESTSRVRAFIPRVSSRLFGMSLPKQNILDKAQSPADWCRTFPLVHVQMGSRSISKMQLGCHLANCRSRPILLSHTSYQEEHEICRLWMTQLDVGLTPSLPATNLGSTAARGGKRIDPWHWL